MFNSLMAKPLRSARQYTRDERGVSAVEFALIAPLMLLIYFGSIELSFLMLAERKTTAAAATLGDLTARSAIVTDQDLLEIVEATRLVFEPFDNLEARMRISSLEEDDGQLAVVWSDATANWTERSVDEIVEAPDGVIPDGGSLIYAEIEFDYESALGYFFTTEKMLGEEFFMRPRNVDFVERDET